MDENDDEDKYLQKYLENCRGGRPIVSAGIRELRVLKTTQVPFHSQKALAGLDFQENF